MRTLWYQFVQRMRRECSRIRTIQSLKRRSPRVLQALPMVKHERRKNPQRSHPRSRVRYHLPPFRQAPRLYLPLPARLQPLEIPAPTTRPSAPTSTYPSAPPSPPPFPPLSRTPRPPRPPGARAPRASAPRWRRACSARSRGRPEEEAWAGRAMGWAVGGSAGGEARRWRGCTCRRSGRWKNWWGSLKRRRGKWRRGGEMALWASEMRC
mmetsp:Transcript_8740/g.21769  ORF Transcript_8740/g.21769 Transcript_8740/m.21769 type:complete len:209 (+) Transcript_8740:563-1189(+)